MVIHAVFKYLVFDSTLKLENKYFTAIFCLFVTDMFEEERHPSGLGLWLKPHLLWLASLFRPYFKTSTAALTPCVREVSKQVGGGSGVDDRRKTTGSQRVQGPKAPHILWRPESSSNSALRRDGCTGGSAWFSSFFSCRSLLKVRMQALRKSQPCWIHYCGSHTKPRIKFQYLQATVE